MQGGKKAVFMSYVGSQFYFFARMKGHIEKNHKSQDLTVSEVWKNTLVEFMKAQSHSYVILVRNHLPKIPNWNYISKECKGEKAVFMSYVWLTILFLYHNERPYWKKSQVARLYCVRGLKEHASRVHEGTKPFLCDSCEESFAKDFKLKLHIKGIQGEKSRFHAYMWLTILFLYHNERP